MSGPCDERVLVEITKTNELLGLVIEELRGLRAEKHPAKPEDTLLTAKQFARLLDVDERTLRRMRAEPGLLPKPVMVGRSPRWKRADVDAWIERKNKR